MNIFNVLSKQPNNKTQRRRETKAQRSIKNLCAFAPWRRGVKITYVIIFTLILAACSSEPTRTSEPPRPSDSETITATIEPTSNTPVPSSTPLPTADTQPTPLPPTPAVSTPIDGGTAVLGLVGQIQSLNPVTDNHPALREVAPLLFDTLVRVDPHTAELKPGLAESWEYSDDGEQVIFHLPTDLAWSDGTPLTADDIVESLEATQHPALLAFTDISAGDDDTLVFTFLNIDCAAVTTLAQLPLLPAQEITATIPIGSGPFTVSEWSENKRTLSLTKNPNHHGQTPHLDGFTIRFLHEDEIEIAVSEGQFDAIGPVELPIVNSQLLTADSQLEIDNSPFTIESYPAPQVTYIAINYDPHNDDPLAPEVREALLLALDRETILAEVLDGRGQLMAGSLLPDHWAANNALSPPDYDPDTARELLANAGLRDSDGDGWLDQRGERLELGIRLNGKNTLHQNLGWLVSSYYRDLGLYARAESVPVDSVVDDLFTHDFTLALFSWPHLPDPDQRLFWKSTENEEGIGLNFTSYNNPQVDALLDQGIAMPGCQLQDRAGIYKETQELLAQDRPVDFLLTPNRHLLVNNHLHGLQPGAFAGFTWNAAEWYLGQ
jgi:peptide/nickel transport system substrate-binding protein